MSDNDQEIDEPEIRENENHNDIINDDTDVTEEENKHITELANDSLQNDLKGKYLLTVYDEIKKHLKFMEIIHQNKIISTFKNKNIKFNL